MSKNLTRDEMKKIAVDFMKELKIYKPYVDGFEKKDDVCMFELFGGYWAYQYQELMDKIKEIEEKYNYLVYAITHEYTAFGECYDFLVITYYKGENELYKAEDGTFYPLAYVWNKTDEWCSEFGEIGVKTFGGGIARVA